MSQSLPPVSPVEYAALPTTDDSSQALPRPSLHQAEPDERSTDSEIGVSRLSQPLPQSSPAGYSPLPSTEVPIHSEDQSDPTRVSEEQPDQTRVEGPGSQSASTQAGSEPKEAPPKKANLFLRYRSSFIWWLETGCCLLVVGGLVGIIATIKSLDGKPLPQWPYRLSINTFIAAFSVLMKASSGLVLAQGISHIKWTVLLRKPRSLHNFNIHDEASRGPWGAITLLQHDLGRSVASLGAFITLLVLYLEPFSQQLVSFVDCDQVRGHQVGTIPRTNYYKPEGGFQLGGQANIPWDLQNSVNQGIFATNKPQVRVECDTGNCKCSFLLDCLSM